MLYVYIGKEPWLMHLCLYQGSKTHQLLLQDFDDELEEQLEIYGVPATSGRSHVLGMRGSVILPPLPLLQGLLSEYVADNLGVCNTQLYLELLCSLFTGGPRLCLARAATIV